MTSTFKTESLSAGLLCMVLPVLAIARATNYDEAKVPKYTLPDPLVMADGTKVGTTEQWRTKRRAELIELFTNEMYGRSPGRPEKRTLMVFDNEPNALGGKATRKQVAFLFTGQDDGPQMDILIYLPNSAKRPIPAFVGLNFGGNHTIHADPAIRLSPGWVQERERTAAGKPTAAGEGRGTAASQWQVEMILARGYAVATVFAGDIDPDFHDGFKNGVHALYPQLQGRGDNFTTIGAWAWGLSWAMDYFETDRDLDAKRIAVFGHSRMGKAALWAGATDERFAMVISNESGEGGAALSRRCFGETIRDLNTRFPHWFCENYRKYNDHEDTTPFDQHMVIALIAPRPVYVASAEKDQWADPRGEFLAAKAAEPVYRLLGMEGLPAEKWPAVDQAVQGQIGYHVRTGSHNVTEYDWTQYLKFADRHLTSGKQQKQ